MQTHIVIPWSLNHWDWVVFVGILFLTIASICYGEYKKKNSNSDSFLEILVMGRSLTLPMFIATLVATWYGGIFGVTAIAFEKGIYNFIIQGVFWYITYLIFAFYVLDKIDIKNNFTLAELVGSIFGPKSQKLAALFNFFNVVPIVYVISLGTLIQMLFGLPMLTSMAIGVAFVVTYSALSGLRSVVYSDIVQFTIMCSSVVIVMIFSFYTFGGIDYLQSNLPKSYFSLTGTDTLAQTIVWGLIALSTLVDPNFYQRCMAAKSKKVAKRGIILSTVIWLIFDLCTTFGAMYAKAVIPDAIANEAYLTYSLQLLPNGLRGFFLAGIAATILSTMDSYIFVASSSLVYDLLPKRIRSPRLYPVGVFFVGLLAIILALYFEGDVKSVWKTLGSYSSACLLLPVLFGVLLKERISDNQFLFTSLAAVITITFWRMVPLGEPWASIDELYIGCLTTGIMISLFFLSNKYLKT